MHSAFILTELRYPAMLLAEQLEHKRFVRGALWAGSSGTKGKPLQISYAHHR